MIRHLPAASVVCYGFCIFCLVHTDKITFLTSEANVNDGQYDYNSQQTAYAPSAGWPTSYQTQATVVTR